MSSSSVQGSSGAYLECSISGIANCESELLRKRIEDICGEVEEFVHHIWELIPQVLDSDQTIDRPILFISRIGCSRWLESESAPDKSAIRTARVKTVKKLKLLDHCSLSCEQVANALAMVRRQQEPRIVNFYSSKHFSGVECIVSNEKYLTLRIRAANQAAVVGCEALLFEFAKGVQDLVPAMNKEE